MAGWNGGWALSSSRGISTIIPGRSSRWQSGNIEGAPTLLPGQRIKVVTFNVQFLAGTGYHFFYDGGPDTLVDPKRH